jgi:hypothetical protein
VSEDSGRTVFLHLHGQRRVRLLDEVYQRGDGMGTQSGHELLARHMRRLHLAGVVLIGRLCLALQVLLVLGRRLGPLEAKLPAGARVARLHAVEVFGELVVLGLRLLRQPFRVLHLVLGGEALLLPRLAVGVHLGGQLQQILVHGVQGEAELGAVVGDALVRVEDLLELRLVALMACLGLAHAVERQAAQLLEAGSLLFLDGAPALEEVGEVLPCLSARVPAMSRGRPPTLALAMLALRRFSSVATPTSECSTSCTRCCEWPSWSAVRCSGDVGAASSMGEARAPSFVGVDALWKSGLKLSVLSMGGIVGGAAIAGTDVMVRYRRGREPLLGSASVEEVHPW